MPGENPTATLNRTGLFRFKGGRLQEGFTHRPWVDGHSDPTLLRWVDVPSVPVDAPDAERWK